MIGSDYVAFINLVVHSLLPMKNRKSIDKVNKLLDLLEKHIHEKNCNDSSIDLLREYEKFTTA
jgi:hypothetical protein